jgi:drug/metabolite transporter (DMT)-like permease
MTSRQAALATASALVCFTANSILCRFALADGAIDAATFTAIRLIGGAAALAVLVRGRGLLRGGSTRSALALFAYAAPFSFAYLELGAGVGALVLFACVQLTMIGFGIVRGERPSALAWLGLILATGGLVALTLRGADAPDPASTALMAVAGASWGVYSLRGRGVAGNALGATASNFVRTVPLAVALAVIAVLRSAVVLSPRGVALALASGVLASGLGYSLWYLALPRLSATRAAVLQLLVPILGAASGVVFLGEALSLRLVLSGAAILGGVGLVIRAKS